MRTDVGLITLHAGVHVPDYVSMSHAARRTLLFFLVAGALTNLPGSCCLGITLPMVKTSRTLTSVSVLRYLGGFPAGCASARHLRARISTRGPLSELRERLASLRWYRYSRSDWRHISSRR